MRQIVLTENPCHPTPVFLCSCSCSCSCFQCPCAIYYRNSNSATTPALSEISANSTCLNLSLWSLWSTILHRLVWACSLPGTMKVEAPSPEAEMPPRATVRPRLADIVRSKAFRRAGKIFIRFLTIALTVCIVLQVTLSYAIASDPRLFPAALQRSKNLLIVTAHPDDETLFFAPSILSVLDNTNTAGGLLVLSNGWFGPCFCVISS